MYGNKENNMNKFAIIFASVIVGILIGVSIMSGQNTTTFVTDYDTLEIFENI